MPQEAHVGVGGAWKKATEVYVGVGAAWQRGFARYTGAGGAWELGFVQALLATGTLSVALGTPPQTVVDLSWVASPTATTVFDEHAIERAPDVGGSPGTWAEIDTVPAGTLAYSSTGLAANTKYHWRVRLRRSPDGEVSTYSNVVTITTTIAAPSSAAEFATGFPKDNAADDDGLLLSVDAVATATQYDVYFKVGSSMAGDPVANGALVDGGAIAAASIEAVAEYLHATGQAHGVVVYYQARARNAGGPGPFGVEKSATVLMRVPGVPTTVVATEDEPNKVDLTWALGSPANETLLRIEKKSRVCGGSWGSYAAHTTVSAGSTALLDIAVLESYEYQFRIRAENAGGNSAWAESNTVSISVTPGVPTGVGAVKGGTPWFEIDVSWTESGSGTHDDTEIWRSATENGTYTLQQTVGAGTTAWTDTVGDLETWWYQVREVNDCGDTGTFSAKASATTDIEPPTGPADFNASYPQDDVADDDGILISIDAIARADEYDVYFKVGSGMAGDPVANGILLGTIAAASIEHPTFYAHATGEGHGTVIYYQARARNSSGVAGWGTEKSATVLERVPGVPSIGTATQSAGTATIPWTPTSPTNQNTFRIQVASRACGGSFGAWGDASPATDTTSPATHPLLEGNEYKFRVRAEGDGGDSAYSSESNIVQWSVVPAAPGSFAATISGVADPTSEVRCSWDDPVTGTWDNFEIEYKLSAAAWTGTPQVTGISAAANSYDVTGLSDDTDYDFRVRAINDCGDVGAWSSVDNAVTDPVVPAAPTWASGFPQPIQAFDDRNRLKVNSVIDADEYDFHGSTTSGFTPGGGNLLVASDADGDWTHTGLNPDETWYYKAISRNLGTNKNEDSGPSAQGTATTHVETPQSFAATQDAGECPGVVFDLAWDDDNSASDQRNEARVIQRDDGSGYSTIHTTAAGDKSYRDTGAVAGTVGYRIRYSSEATYATDTVTVDCPE